MPRRRGGGGFGGRKKQGGGACLAGSGRRADGDVPAAPSPGEEQRAGTRPAAPAQKVQGGDGSGMMGMVVKEWRRRRPAAAHRAIGAVADGMSGGGDAEQQQQMQDGGYAAAEKQRALRRKPGAALSMPLGSGRNAAACQFFFDALRDCQENQRYAQSHQ